MTLTAFYFYQELYVLFSSLNHFSSCQRENRNKWREEKKHTQIHLTITSRGYTSQTPYQYSHSSITASYCSPSFSQTSFTLSHSYRFLSTFSLLGSKMSYETQMPLLTGDVQHVIWYRRFDNSITVATVAHVFWQDWWPHDITVHRSGDKTMEFLTDGYMSLRCAVDCSRKCTEKRCLVLMCELCHLCLSDNPRSILNHIVFLLFFFCFQQICGSTV